MSESSEASRVIQFDRFTLLPLRRQLLADDAPIELGGRAFDVLVALIDAHGSVVSKNELITRVWPGRIIEENTLEAQVSAVRKALAPNRDLVRTVAGRGYQFTGEISASAAPASATLPTTQSNLPQPVSELIGRNAEVREVTDLVIAHRLITLLGPGGIGKTRLSLEVAHHVRARFADGASLAELGALSDPDLVPVTVATALGVTLTEGALSPERVAAALGTQQRLLVLDNCEHVIAAATRMAEVLLRANAVTCILATSREPLRAPGEYIYRVAPLSVPAEGTQDEDELLRYGAVELFVARARAADPGFSLTPDGATLIGWITRRVDGIPLAIELAAARTVALGVEALAARLDDRFKLLTGGHRTALPRHQTLRATLDWSYDLLPEAERVVLRRLAIFAGSFSLNAAGAVAAHAEITGTDVVDCVVNLVAKSLLTAAGSTAPQYRLLETTRAYALEKLGASGELERFLRRHADYYRRFFETAAVDWETQPTAQWLAAYGGHLDNVRTALDWASSRSGDAQICVALTAAAVPLWMHLSLMEECRGRAEHALATLRPEPQEGSRAGMQLYAALGLALMYTRGAVPETRAALTRALEIAECLQDIDYQLRALWGLSVDRLNNAAFREALAFAGQFYNVAERSADAVDLPIGDRMTGLALHYLGDQAGARRHFERMLARYVAPSRRSHMIRFQFDQRVTAQVALAAVVWLQGFPDRALRIVETNIEEALGLHHALSLCNALAKACPVALLAGDLVASERFVTMLMDHSARHALASWQTEGRCFHAVWMIKHGQVAAGAQALQTALAELPAIKFALRYTALLADLAEALVRLGDFAQAGIAIDQALARSESNEERWYMPELLRIKGELMLAECAPDAAAAAEQLFRKGIEWARRQDALSWELRCATSLARLWHEQGETAKARHALATVYGQFREGFGTADLISAKAILDSLR